ncbi:hypothetical protein FRC06_011153 [Ceratobasidium sp. 370]|nr:hypothetical protein FRC06_011153 [Ceratobasidium sp. 370]
MPYMQWGFVATVVICLMVGYAALPLRRWSYEIFLVLHVLFAAFLIAGCYYHMVFRFNWRYGYLNWIKRFGDDRARAQFNTKHNQAHNLPSPGTSAHQARNTLFRLLPQATIPSPLGKSSILGRNLGIARGSDRLFRHKRRGRHVQGSDIEKAKSETQAAVRSCITMLVKPHAGATRTLLDYLLTTGGTASVPISLEGPYGEPHPLHLYENVVLIAGGIGITPALAYAQDLNARGRQVTLFWASRDAGLIKSVRSMLPENVGTKIYYTGGRGGETPVDEVPDLRPNVSRVVRDQIQMDRAGRTAFFACGPPEMVYQVRTACVGYLGDDVPADKIGFYEECFSW